MSEGSNGQSEGQAQEPERPVRQLPALRPHLTVVRHLIYQGDAEAIKAQLDQSLPDGLFFEGSFTLTVRSEAPEPVQPEWLSAVRYDLMQAAKAKAEKARSVILSPHTLRPMK